MRGLWGKLWVRIVLSVLVAPFILVLAVIACGDTIGMVLKIWDRDMSMSLNEMIPPLDMLLWLMASSEVAVWPPLIAVELNNRRHAEPVPPQFCAAFVAIMGVASTGVIWSFFMAFEHVDLGGNWIVGIGILLGTYIAGITAAYVLLAPYIRHWRTRRNAVSEQAARIF